MSKRTTEGQSQVLTSMSKSELSSKAKKFLSESGSSVKLLLKLKGITKFEFQSNLDVYFKMKVYFLFITFTFQQILV